MAHHELAQLNIARLLEPIDSPALADKEWFHRMRDG